MIGAVSGGTAGGAMLDVAYALRGELKRLGVSDEHVHGVLLHATPRSAADRDRARANAYSTMSELHHFSRPGSHYPGEPLLGAPPFHGDNATFGRVHLLRLGEGVGNVEWDLVTDQIAQLQRAGRIPVTRICLTCRYFDGYAHPGTNLPHHCHLVDAPFGYREFRLRCPEQTPPRP